MNSIARRLVVFAIAVFVTGLFQVASAQGMGGGQGRGMRSPEEQAKMLKEQLSLTDEQTAKVTKILADQQKDRQEKMGEFQGDREAMREYFTKAIEKSNAAIKALLNEEQLKKYEQIMKERQQRMQNRPPRNN